ncbi:ATP-binding protein [Archangium gephyra]|uniref:sensor histidine kinase n=1 Tax=Archangium gephyra TaxID=48 RepID=UPI001470F924|nr:ATP-binding protein [Archangium gephyra]
MSLLHSRSQLLGRMSRELASCTGREEVYRCLGRVALPELGDWCDLDVLQDGVLQRAAAFRAPHGAVHGPPGGPPSLLARRVARSGHPELLQGPDEQVAVLLSSGEETLPRVRAAGPLDCMAVPLRLAGQLLGVLSFASREPELHLDEDALALAEDLAGCVALALETDRLRQELKRARHHAQRQAADFQTLLDVIPVGIGIAYDRECRYIHQNGWFARLHGLPLESNISLSAPDTELQPIRYLDGNGRALIPEELPMQRAAATGQEVLDVELDLEVHGQRRGTIVVSAVPLFDEEHRPRGSIGTIQDVTARKRATEAQRFLAESSVALSSSLDPEQTSRTLVELCVPALASVAAFCGWRPDGTLGMLMLTHADPTLQPLADEVARTFVIPEGHPIHEAMMTGRPRLIPVLEEASSWYAGGEAQRQGPCHGLGVHSVMLIPLAAPQGVAGVLVLGSTDRACTEEDFTFAQEYAAHATYAIDNARLYREARDAISLRDEFLSIAGHELRTPLTSLQLGLLHIVRESATPGDPARLSKWVAMCQRQGERVGRLVGCLLDVSRITAGRLPMVLEEMDLSALMEEVAARMGAELEKVGCPLVLKLQSPLRGRWDRSRLDQVLTNLLGNAMKYGQGRPIEVTTLATPEGVCVRIRDEGIGISPEDQARIFGRFERAVSERHYGGLGLGLWISRQIVTELGGHIRVESVQGQGSSFTVELPRWVEG